MTQKINVKDESRLNYLEVQEKTRPKEAALGELYENAECRVPNNMTKVCVTNSKNYVICNGRGKSRRAMRNKR